MYNAHAEKCEESKRYVRFAKQLQTLSMVSIQGRFDFSVTSL